MSYSLVELIAAKRDGEELDPGALRWIITEYTAGRVPSYQVSALLMAIIFKGMTQAELGPWTEAMLHSGDVLDLSALTGPKVDKHSTGGVGDKISIPLVPIVVACGIAVPMISGRGLGHTGGTLDKLESIPGFSTQYEPERINRQMKDIGAVMVGQTDRLVPADRKIYALRDATGTVPSDPLISSSIMSKKLAEDIDGLLLDVKVGSGAFKRTLDDATKLASMMVGIGVSHDTPVTVVFTNMDQPLGRAVGNANEIAESIEVLRGGGPPDVVELTMRFAEEMLMLAGSDSRLDAAAAVEKAVSSGAAFDTMAKIVEHQGGNPAVLDDLSLLPSAPHEHVLTAETGGYIVRCDAYEIGLASVRLGAGRTTKKDQVDHSVGLMIEAKVGDTVEAGQPLATISYRDEDSLESALSVLVDTFVVSAEPVEPPDLILGELR